MTPTKETDVNTAELQVGYTYSVVADGLAEFVGIYLGRNEVGLMGFKYRLDADAEGRNTITQMRRDEITSALPTDEPLRRPGFLSAARAA